MLKDKLFWIKYRPKSLVKTDDSYPIILLPRIRKIFESGEIPFNCIFYGTGGLGKTTLSEILIQGTDYINIDCSIETGVDVVRTKITDHCRNYTIPLKRRVTGNIKGQKVVLLEEFDKTSPQMRGALRGFVEKYSDVRFIANVNKMSAINRGEDDSAFLSRFNMINFNPRNKEEIKYLKTEYFKYIKYIFNDNKFDITDEIIKTLINKTFPNLRSTVQIVQEIILTKDYDKYLKEKTLINLDIYSFMLNNNNNLTENFYYVNDNFPKEKTEELLKILSYDFIKYLIKNYEYIMITNGLKIIDLITKFNATYLNTLDPETHLVTYITKMKELLKK